MITELVVSYITMRGINPCNSYFTQWKCDTVEIVLIFLVRGLCAAPTLVGVQAKDGVFTTKTDAESPAGRGSAFGVGDLHQVDVAVGGNKVHAAQWVRANPSLPDRGPHLVPQFQSKLCEKEKQNGRSHEEEGNEFSELKNDMTTTVASSWYRKASDKGSGMLATELIKVCI